ncbi:hypothetical protein RD792_011316 [Penstemon davidsonii]|uniref:anthranilate synthase n=1 Tax=Penstemon davidsonii TaxID=160366 RepID=A0ABR0D496_9LAMI|nr:hypothetical protein RD792_011316 [Penstemon davidsonii]
MVCVEDPGIGIPKHAQKRVFTPFMQADSSTSRNYGGTGIGLSISKCLVELMGGQMNFTSRLNIGSTFSFTIGYRRCEKDEVIDIKKSLPDDLPIALKGLKALVVDGKTGAPQDSGISLQTVLQLGPTVPLFGVCMGLQCIGEAFGGKIVRSPYGVVHGKSSLVYYNEGGEDGLFTGLSNPFTAGRYHSLVIEKESFPSDVLEITAWTEDGLVMAARHKVHKYLQGVQFHPESIITSEGKTIVHNFIKMIERKEAESRK